MRFRRIVSVLLVIAYLPACAGYQATSQSLAELTAPPEPARQVRVTLADGSRVQVTSPRVEADTLRGTEGRSRTSGAPVAISLATITNVEVVPHSNSSQGAKVAIIAVAIGLSALLIILLTRAVDCGWMCD